MIIKLGISNVQFLFQTKNKSVLTLNTLIIVYTIMKKLLWSMKTKKTRGNGFAPITHPNSASSKLRDRIAVFLRVLSHLLCWCSCVGISNKISYILDVFNKKVSKCCSQGQRWVKNPVIWHVGEEGKNVWRGPDGAGKW